MEESEKLFILWTSKEIETFDEMVFMYALNSKKQGWWKEVTLIIWGASAQLAGTDKAVQLKIKELSENGVHVTACKACAEDLGVAYALENIGVEVKYWGNSLTQVLKSGSKLLTV